MAVKTCCIEGCKSSTARKEDKGVTFIKFPSNATLRKVWLEVTQCDDTKINTRRFVCSRHFRKSDFKPWKEFKYMLKTDAAPSIFPWGIATFGLNKTCRNEMENSSESISEELNSKEVVTKKNTDETIVSSVSEDIQDDKSLFEKIVVKAEEDLKDLSNDKEQAVSTQPTPKIEHHLIDEVKDEIIQNVEPIKGEQKVECSIETFKELKSISDDIKGVIHDVQPNKSTSDNLSNSAATDVIHKILNQAIESVHSASTKKNNAKGSKRKSTVNSIEKDNSSMALSVGSRVEAKDFGELWHPARIVEVDYDEMEVLVHYDNWSQRHDEWISVSSPRLRPLSALQGGRGRKSGGADSPGPPPTPLLFQVGERCLARWSDNRRFPATVRSVVGNGKYEIVFDDGFVRICKWSHLFKVKQQPSGYTNGTPRPGSSGQGQGSANSFPLSVTTPVRYGARGELSPTAPFPINIPTAPVPFHKHLFDPTRDYLGPKSERREMKRTLNVKALFNIGQSRKKTSDDSTSRKRKQPPPKKVAPPKKPKLERKASGRGANKSKPAEVTPKPEPVELPLPEIKEEMPGNAEEEKKVSTNEIEKELTLPNPLKISEIKNDADEDQKVAAVKEETEESMINKPLELDKTDHIESPIDNKLTDQAKIIDPELAMPGDVVDSVLSNDGESENTNIEPAASDESKDKIVCTPKTVSIKLDEVEKTLDLPIDKLSEGETEMVKNENSVKEEIDNGTELTKSEHVPVMEDSKDLSCLETIQPQEKISEAKKSKEGNKRNKKVKKIKKLSSARRPKGIKKKAEKPRVKNSAMKNAVVAAENTVPPEARLSEGEWCCRWVNGHPQGVVSELEAEPSADSADKPVLPRRSVQVEDNRMPPGWTKHMVRRSCGSSAGKWDVVLVSPEDRRFRTRHEMRVYLDNKGDEQLKSFESVLLDFGVHRKLSRRFGWDVSTVDGKGKSPPIPLPLGTLSSTSPIAKRRKLSLKKKIEACKSRIEATKDELNRKRKSKSTKPCVAVPETNILNAVTSTDQSLKPELDTLSSANIALEGPLEDGFVYVGSMKVQIIDNLFRCPSEGCFKNFRKDNLLRMHIKHYHRDMRKMLGATPKVLDLAYARTKSTDTETPKPKVESDKVTKPKASKSAKRIESDTIKSELRVDIAPMSTQALPKVEPNEKQLTAQDSPKLRSALESHVSSKKAKVLYPVRKLELESVEQSPQEELKVDPEVNAHIEEGIATDMIGTELDDLEQMPKLELEDTDDEQKPTPDASIEPQDFEAAISTHTVTKPVVQKKRRSLGLAPCMIFKKKQRSTVVSEEDDWDASDFETRSSYGTPESKVLDSNVFDTPTPPPMSVGLVTPSEEHKDASLFITETGEKIKIVQMKREEIINCHCGFGEEDGLMVQCELCLCWQHALCHNIEKESQVPDKYTCSICLNPRRGRRSQRFLHDQERMYEGTLPGARPCDALRRSHELSGNLLRLTDALHALRVKYHVVTKKDHPKLYLWAKDWERTDSGIDNMSDERVTDQIPMNTDYVNLDDMISKIGKENLPLKSEDIKDVCMTDIRTPPSEETEMDHRFTSQKDDNQLGSQALLANLLASPGGPSLELPISTSELERLAKSVQEREAARGGGGAVPVPEAAIESTACRERLLRHIRRCQALVDARLDSIEAQVAELESQDPSFEDDETADYFPRTKQTIQMMLRDLDTMEELGQIT